MPTIHKVTCFIIRSASSSPELLLFNHPNAGVQIPAGTINPDEDWETAAMREAAEESGLEGLSLVKLLGEEIEPSTPGYATISVQTMVYSRPDRNSFDWASFRPGIEVELLRHKAGYTQVGYKESDRIPNPQYTTYAITGWVPDGTLAEQRVRHFCLFKAISQTPARWKVQTDEHVFELFWAPINNLPAIIPPQNGWLTWLAKAGFSAG